MMYPFQLPPSQIISAMNYYKEINKNFKNFNIIFTGHSLGGSIAQILGSQYGNKTYTFSAYGTANLLKHQIKNYENIVNIGNRQDPVFISNIQNQIGKTYIIGDFEKDTKEITKSPGIISVKPNLEKHKIENMGDLSDAVEYKGEDLQTKETVLFKLSIEKNIDLRYADPNTIITTEEIDKMTSEEFTRNEDCIYQKLKEGKIMPKAEANRRHLSVQNTNTEKSNTKNTNSQLQNGDGHWVTINGNHVLID